MIEKVHTLIENTGTTIEIVHISIEKADISIETKRTAMIFHFRRRGDQIYDD